VKAGDLYEFHSVPMGTVTTYELENSESSAPGAIARLRNVETDGTSQILCKSLRSRDGWPSKSYWKRVEE
jgi:hypothetical protein